MTIQYLERGTSTFHLTPSDLLTDVLFSLFPFYVFYMPRYMRLKIVSAEKEVEPIMSGREAAYHEAFGMVSSHGPVFVLTALLGTVAIPLSGFEPRLSALNLLDVVSVYLSSLGFATYLWVYASSSWEAHR